MSPAPRPERGAESDVPADEALARSRETGGDPDRDERDAPSTTGTGASGEFVGRVAGGDEADAEETGAEARTRGRRFRRRAPERP